MILNWKSYIHSNNNRFAAGDGWEQAEEVKSAQALIRRICDANSISEKIIDDELRNGCSGWPRAMEAMIDLSSVRKVGF